MRVDRSTRLGCRAEISIVASVRHSSRTQAIAGLRMRDELEMAQAKFAAEIIFPRTGGTTSLRSIQATGSAIGIAVAITSGTGVIADSSTAPGSSSTSDSIHGGRIGTRTTITPTAIRTVTTRAITIQALTKTGSIIARTATAIMPIPL